TGSQHKDYPCWLAGVNISHALGTETAWSFDMSALCGSMMAGMEVAKSLILSQERYKTILLVSGYRDADIVDFKDPETSFLFDLGAGGAALILQKNCNKNLVLSTAFKVDGSFSEGCVVPYGGAKNWPMQEQDVKKMHMTLQEATIFKEKLRQNTMPNFYAVIREALTNAGLTQQDINYLAILHFKRSAHMAALEELGLNENQTTYLDEYGHIGQNDQVLSIEIGLKGNKIKTGDNIVMTAAGLGFVWSAAIVKWGKIEEIKK
ncbi:MAG: 3-oxoacyl-ACP synthase, partial [Gammaproteobacteria bacterium]|nr:3-oxoacyl-ACP synthase [Gammaproteobacteria bacterium]